MRTLTTYLDDDGTARLVVSWTRPNDGGAFVGLTDEEGTTVESLYSVPWIVLRRFALELLAVVDDEDDTTKTCGSLVPCRAAVLPSATRCYECSSESDS